ncbi:hypothetical protein C2G38_2048249 [Gigaspora rosea]|uniref:Uncharacterized protein n=1 Tax=Gigaspora rosea TaxID=44941 RepID=A0A397U7C9_9GLOM|nr:hypothetical protein C2G38_2048249 [Gigaspora rosea]
MVDIMKIIKKCMNEQRYIISRRSPPNVAKVTINTPPKKKKLISKFTDHPKKNLSRNVVGRWFHSNYASNFEVPPNLNYINICRECNKKYKKKENLNLQKPLIETELEETIDLTIDVTSNIQEYKEIKTLPKKKL